MTKLKKVAAIATSIALFAPMAALADINSSSLTITVQSNGVLSSDTTAVARTGGNTAGGSRGGSGGTGGDVEVDGAGNFNNGGSSAGNGGNGGNAGDGGLIVSGDANADAGSLNSLNTTDIDLGADSDCGCDDNDVNSSSLTVDVDNATGISFLDQDTTAVARSGGNVARGSRGGNGGVGGDIEVDGGGDNNNGGASAGTGGAGGAGGLGGEVRTGVATSNAGSINVMNTILVRLHL